MTSTTDNSQLFIDKYKPIYFNDFIIDPQIIELLKSLIDINEINIIFSGSPFTGKTTLINALIREYYTKDLTLDVYDSNILRINNLKEQGIHYFRNEIKTFCQTSSSVKNKKKLLILDDIDSINEQCQQILRSFIDKYSKNVNFICCCNNTQKIIESLHSRLINICMDKLESSKIETIIKKIIYLENINIDLDAYNFILNVSLNINNIINYLEKFKLLDTRITLEIAMDNCTNINFNHFEKFTTYIKKRELINAISIIYSICDKGFSVIDILDNYFLFIKITNILTEDEKYKIIPYICKYITIFYNINEDELELSLFTNDIIQLF